MKPFKFIPVNKNEHLVIRFLDNIPSDYLTFHWYYSPELSDDKLPMKVDIEEFSGG